MDNKESTGKKKDAKSKARRKSFQARHAKNIAKVKCLQHSGLIRLSGLREEAMPYKDYSAKQKKIANVAPPFNKITGADFAMLRKKKKRKR